MRIFYSFAKLLSLTTERIHGFVVTQLKMYDRLPFWRKSD